MNKKMISSLILVLLINSGILFAESNLNLYFSMGLGYIFNFIDESEHNKSFVLQNSFIPALNLQQEKNHLKIDYKVFDKNWDDQTDEVSNELTGWKAKDVSLKYGRALTGKNNTVFSAYAGIGGLFWKNEYMKSVTEEEKDIFYLTLPLELELSQKLSDNLRGGISIYNDLNAKCPVWGAGINLQVKIF